MSSKDQPMLGRKRFSPLEGGDSRDNRDNRDLEIPSNNPINLSKDYPYEVKKEEGELSGRDRDNRDHREQRANRDYRDNRDHRYPRRQEGPRDKEIYFEEMEERGFSKFEGHNKNTFYQKERRSIELKRNHVDESYGGYIQDNFEGKRKFESGKKFIESKGRSFGRRRSDQFVDYHEEPFRRNSRVKGGYMRGRDEDLKEMKMVKRRSNYNDRGDRLDRNLDRFDKDRQRDRERVDRERVERDRERERSSSYPLESPHQRSKSGDLERSNKSPVMEKNYNFLMMLPKNYFRFIENDFKYLTSELEKKVRDLDLFQYDYRISQYPDYILRLDAPKVSSKALALKIICDSLFHSMKQTYHNMSYLKVSILVPSHVVGFIIGIEGKNINGIRDISGARIDVFQNDIGYKYRQIELQGSPEQIAKSSEKIYKIVNKYYFFNSQNERNEAFVEAPESRRRIRLRLAKREGGKSSKPKRDQDEKRERNGPNEDSRRKEKSLERLGRNESKFSQENQNINAMANLENISAHNSLEKLTDNNSSNYSTNPVNTSILESKGKIINPTSNINIEIPNASTNAPNVSNVSNNLSNIVPPNTSINQPQKKEEKMTISIIVPDESLNMLRNINTNIFIEIENHYKCSISKAVEKLNNKDVNIVTLTGPPQQNALAIHCLQQAMAGNSEYFKNFKN